MFDYFIDWKSIRLKSWQSLTPGYQHDRNISFFNIFVPTSETVKFNVLSSLLVSNKISVLIIGNSGVGKSSVMNNYLNTLDENVY